MEVGEPDQVPAVPRVIRKRPAALTLSHAADCTTRTVYCCSKIGTAECWIFCVSATVASALSATVASALTRGSPPRVVGGTRRRFYRAGGDFSTAASGRRGTAALSSIASALE